MYHWYLGKPSTPVIMFCPSGYAHFESVLTRGLCIVEEQFKQKLAQSLVRCEVYSYTLSENISLMYFADCLQVAADSDGGYLVLFQTLKNRFFFLEKFG